MRFLVTGSNGFIGRTCIETLERLAGAEVVGTVRSPTTLANRVNVGELGSDTDWRVALVGVDVVVHAAARVHMNDKAPGAHEAHIAANAEGTVNLARQAASAGVRRLVFISTIAVNGQETPPGRPFSAADTIAPAGSYAIAKAEAETRLQTLSAETGIELVIIRPPMVYGPDAPGNFSAMIRWVKSGVPLPLGRVNNRRSMVSIDNLVDLIVTSATHPAAPGHIFLAADGEDLSTTEWLKAVGKAVGRKPRLLPIPVALLRFGASSLGMGETARRLLGSLQIDIAPTRQVLCWTPPLTIQQSLARL